MSSLTFIHLSDLHIGQKDEKGNEPPQDCAGLNAKKLINDLLKIREEKSISFRPDETFFLISGDITNTCKWDQFEIAIMFIEQIRKQYSLKFGGFELSSDHFICIPGNHDLKLAEIKNPKVSFFEKYLPFKSFLDFVTDYSSFARSFTHENPFINIRFDTPLSTQIIWIDTCRTIDYFDSRPKEKRKSLLQGTFGYITEDYLSSLEKTLLLEDQKVLRIALMHHPLTDLSTGDSTPSDGISISKLISWLTKHKFALIFSGHIHYTEATGYSKPDHKMPEYPGSISENSVGHSFPTKPSVEPISYEIIQIEEHFGKTVSRKYTRQFSWSTNTLADEKNKWTDNSESKNPINLPKIYNTKDFLGIKGSNVWHVISHCKPGKFENYGAQSPGEVVNSLMLHLLSQPQNDLIHVTEKTKINWNIFAGNNLLFVIDSPHFNPYTRQLLTDYKTYLAGGNVEFIDEPNQLNVKQRIQIGNQPPLASTKQPEQTLFDCYEDYLLIMRLPGFEPHKKTKKLEIKDLDENKVIWIIAGIHSKASYAGTQIFNADNLQKFTSSLNKLSNGKIPKYFEIVYKVPQEKPKITDFSSLERVYFNVLRLKKDVAMGDDLPSGVAVILSSNKNVWAKTPVHIVHLDPVAGCNYSCPECIENEMKNKNLFLSIKSCIRILCDLKKIGCERINFYGGEPTLHPEFPELLNATSAMGYNSLLVTNGSQLHNQDITNSLIYASSKIHIRVSLDAHNQNTYEKIHGINKNTADVGVIKDTIKFLINQGIPVSISILVRPEIVNELESAVNFWRNAHATAIILRPLTARNGKGPILPSKTDDSQTILSILNKNKGFVLTPFWFHNLLQNHPETQKKDYYTCYSGYYRIAISPYNESCPKAEKEIESIPLTQTNDAWISLCTYRRFDPNFGCKYPSDLNQWLKDYRQQILNKIDPSKNCNEIFCCRDGYNRQISSLTR
ncbi:MAG: metallophosphoesterase [bacterium]|nr:metallophosphoesterase [bacterium]